MTQKEYEVILEVIQLLKEYKAKDALLSFQGHIFNYEHSTNRGGYNDIYEYEKDIRENWKKKIKDAKYIYVTLRVPKGEKSYIFHHLTRYKNSLLNMLKHL